MTGQAKRIGLIVLATDRTSERDYRMGLEGTGIDLYVNRVPYANPMTIDNLRAVLKDLRQASDDLLPGIPFDAIAFSCTSASALIGDDAVFEAIKGAKPDASVVTPPLASVHAFQSLHCPTISLLTPYDRAITDAMAGYFESHGLGVAASTSLELNDDQSMAALGQDVIIAHAKNAFDPASEALFISCTALRSLEAIDRIEQAIGAPVVTSNQAALWACLCACGVTAAPPAAVGRLMKPVFHSMSLP